VIFELPDIKIPVYGFKYPEPRRDEELKSTLMLLLLIIIPFTKSQLIELLRMKLPRTLLLHSMGSVSSMLSCEDPNTGLDIVKKNTKETMPI
jgi:hypothetical protein